ncbi:MAG: hypothetical protein J5940_05485, partial [Clostridia bacterium]|nr:hypothetical protein [Clostridia bacterium]
MKKKNITDIISNLDDDIIEKAAGKRAEYYTKKEIETAHCKAEAEKAKPRRTAVMALAAAAVVIVLSISLIPIMSVFDKNNGVSTNIVPDITSSSGESSRESGTESATESAWNVGSEATESQSSGQQSSASATENTDFSDTATATETSATETGTSAIETETSATETGATETGTSAIETETSAIETGATETTGYVVQLLGWVSSEEDLRSGKYASSSKVPYEEPPKTSPNSERKAYRLYVMVNPPEGYTTNGVRDDDGSSNKIGYIGESSFCFCVYNSVSAMQKLLLQIVRSTFSSDYLNRYISADPDSLRIDINNCQVNDDVVSYLTVSNNDGIILSYTKSCDKDGNLNWEYYQKRYIYGIGACLFRYDLDAPCAFSVSDGGPSLEELLAIEIYRDPAREQFLNLISDGGGYLGCEFASLEELITAFKTQSILHDYLGYPSIFNGQLPFEFLEGVYLDKFIYLKGLPEGSTELCAAWYSGSEYQIIYSDPAGEII